MSVGEPVTEIGEPVTEIGEPVTEIGGSVSIIVTGDVVSKIGNIVSKSTSKGDILDNLEDDILDYNVSLNVGVGNNLLQLPALH